jgi:hypothetical protein
MAKISLYDALVRAEAPTHPNSLDVGEGNNLPDNFDAEDMDEGVLQYMINGEGFCPAPPAVNKLPAGIYKIEVINNANTFVPHKIYSDELIRLPDSKSDEVIAEIERFWPLKDVFKKYGFSHKRGILLHGMQGCGKTSCLSIVAKDIVKKNGIVILQNGTPPISLSFMLSRFRKVEPDRPVLVIMEDLDATIKQFGETETLSLLDGEDSINGVVYIGTTNYPEDLDKRVTNRPSRFDRVIEIGMPNLAARLMYIESRNLPLTKAQVEQWAEMTDGLGVAHIKELIVSVICLGNDFNKEIDRLHDMKKTPTSSGNNARVGFGND